MKKTNPLSVRKIEAYANKIRREFNVEVNSHFPIYEILEKMHNDGSLTIQIMDDNNSIFADENELAKYSPIDNFIYVKEKIIVGYEENDYRSNFTLAHEFFHYIQHKVLEFKFYDVEICKSYEDPEWQANEFAGQLLIPTSFLEYDDEVLCEMFHVTAECVVTRKLYYKKRKERRGLKSY